MPQSFSVELFVYLVTALSALLLLPRSSNWRFRLLIGTVGLQALAHAASELRNHHPFWQNRLGHLTGVTEMFGGALALTAIYLLKRENRDRRTVDARLRLSEAAEMPLPTGQSILAGAAKADKPVDNDALDSLQPVPASEPPESHPWKESLIYAPRRKDTRYPIEGEVTIVALGSPKSAFRGQLVDMSRGGARFYAYEPVPEGTALEMEVGGRMFFGESRYCEESDGRYSIGVQFEQSLDLAQLKQMLRQTGVVSA